MIVTAVVSSGCGSDEEGAFAEIQREIFQPSCALPSCHNQQRQAGGLVLEGPEAYRALVDAPAVLPTARAEGWRLVVPGDPEASFLWVKINPPLDTAYGELMPWGDAEGLPPAQRERIEAWILAGAPEH